MGARPRSPKRLSTGLAAVGLWLGGCGLQNFLDDGRCFVSSDCLSGEECVSVEGFDGFCVAQANDNALTLALEISPDQNSGFARQQFMLSSADLVAPIADLGALSLESLSPVDGTVLALGVSGFPRVLVRATSSETPLIRGTSPESFETTSDEQGGFSLSLRPGRYDLVVTPIDRADLPPVVLRGLDLPDVAGERLNLVLDGGRLLRGNLVADGVPLRDIRVVARALDVEGVIDPDLRSTLAVSDELGNFTLALPRSVDRFVLQLEPANANGDSAFVPAENREIDVSGLPSVEGALQLGALDVGVLEEPILFVGHVGGPAANTANPPLDAESGTALTFTRIERFGSLRRFSRRVVVEEQGEFSVSLLPGEYQVSATTLAGSELASGSLPEISAECPAEPCELEFSLSRRHTVFGEILDPLGENAQGFFAVEARLAGRPETGAVGATFSDAFGRGYSLLLDPGVYDFSFIPPASGGVSTGLLFQVDTTRGDPTVADLQLFSSSLVAGVALGEGGEPVPATVRVFAISDDGAFYPLGTTSTDALGRFVAVVPNPPADSVQFAPLLP